MGKQLKSKKATKIKTTNKLILQKIDNSLVGFDADTSYLYTFNETAEYIFKKKGLGWNENKIVEALAKKYEVTIPQLRKDVKKLIKDMQKNNIIA